MSALPHVAPSIRMSSKCAVLKFAFYIDISPGKYIHIIYLYLTAA